ncbi:PP2C family protein-serine/threonine phosphatase [Streptomyces thermolineatus]|uniref:PP2C family protein-serine/threonine phosphatase n=1 Tax=Streptomyces thermolineatus TaxID=44033 RepID=UPI00384B59E5
MSAGRPPARGGDATPARRRRGEDRAVNPLTARWRYSSSLPWALIALGAALDLATPPDVTATPLYTAAPLVAAPLLSWRATLLTGLAAIAAEMVVDALAPGAGGAQRLMDLLTTAVITLLAVDVNRMLGRHGERLESVRSVALAAQRAVLPLPPPRLGPLTVAARYVAADADARIGGDLYAVQQTPYGVRALIGDVRGKGLGAVEAVAVAVGAFREAAEQEAGLDGVARRLESALDRDIGLRTGVERAEGFVTAVLAEFPPGAQQVRLVNRGHPPPLLVGPGGRTVRPVEPGHAALPLGMGELAAAPDRVDTVDFPRGALLLLYTDGLTEARNAAGEFYDPVPRLSGTAHAGPEELLDDLLADVRRHTGGVTEDDMALLAVSRG